MNPELVIRRVLVVDDLADNRARYAGLALNRPVGHSSTAGELKTEVSVAASAAEARQLLLAASRRGDPFDVLVTDLFMDPESGTRLIQTLPALGFSSDMLDVVLVSDVNDARLRQNEIDATQKLWRNAGGSEFTCVLRVDVAEQDESKFCDAVWAGLFKRIAPTVRASPKAGRQITPANWGSFFITRHAPLIAQTETLARDAARSSASICVTGRSGVGKERYAQLLHGLSGRANKPFVAVNVKAIPAGLFEAQMFGWQKGSFTGAISDTFGFFERAAGGTVFLDEIGVLAKELQSSLLRVLQERQVQRIGGPCVDVDFRVISATSKDLASAVRAHEFDEGLYHRLTTFAFELPSLEARPEDVPPLAEFFWARYGNGTALQPPVLMAMQQRRWDGEVRRLESYCEVLGAITKEGASVTLSDLQRADGANPIFSRVPGMELLDSTLQRTLHYWFYPRLRAAAENGKGLESVVRDVADGLGFFFANDQPAARQKVYDAWRNHKAACETCREFSTRLPQVSAKPVTIPGPSARGGRTPR